MAFLQFSTQYYIVSLPKIEWDLLFGEKALEALVNSTCPRT